MSHTDKIERDLRDLSRADRQTVVALAYQYRAKDRHDFSAMARLLRDIADGEGDTVRGVAINKGL